MAAAGKVVFKVIGITAGLVSTKVTRKALDAGWRKVRGSEPPRNPAVPGAAWSEAVTWAVASGIAMGLSKMLAAKGAATAWQKTTGSLPPGVTEAGA